MDIEKTIAILRALMAVAGDITASEMISWVQVEENAQKLAAEGHEDDPENS